MNVLMLNQCFQPDVVSTAQHLTDLAVGLASRRHRVTVICSSRGYDDPALRFPRREVWRDIQILRVCCFGFNKASKLGRAANFASFMLASLWPLLWIDRSDLVVALSSPPLISLLGAVYARMRRARFVFWMMDLNPDEAIIAGWLKPSSMAAKLLDWLLRYSLCHADRIVVLDRFMEERLQAKGVPAQKICVVAPWAHDDCVRFDPEGRERFRRKHGLDGRFVVMYSGNHSPCHPLDTLLQAAASLAGDPGIVFCFVGGGSEYRRIEKLAADMKNVVLIPYQPLRTLSASLSAADLHVVVMGDAFVGIVHPCKIYNILTVGSPVLYIGPGKSHILDILSRLEGAAPVGRFRHGETHAVASFISSAAARGPTRAHHRAAGAYSKQALLPKVMIELESLDRGEQPAPAAAVAAAAHDSAGVRK